MQFCHIVINPRMGSFFAHLADLPTMPPQRSFPANCTPGLRLIPSYIYFNVSVVFIIFRFRLISGPVVSSSTLFSAAPFPLTMSTSPHFSGLFALTRIEYCRKQLKPISCKNRYTDQEWLNHGEALIEIYFRNTLTPNFDIFLQVQFQLLAAKKRKSNFKLIICHFQEDQRWRLSYSWLPEQECGKNCSEYRWKWQSAWKNTIIIQKPSSSCATRCPCFATCCRRTRWREPRWRTWGSTSGSSRKEVARPFFVSWPDFFLLAWFFSLGQGCPSYLFPDRVTDTSIVDTDAIAEVKRIMIAQWGLPKNHQMVFPKSAKINATTTSQTFLPF